MADETHRPDSSGRIAVVTGGASGLGAAVVRALQAAGARVVALDADAAGLERLRAETGVAAHAVDVTQDGAVEAVFARIAHEVGPVSILVCCAGIAAPGMVVRKGAPMPLEEFGRVIDVNLMGTLNAIRCAVPQMINARGGPDEDAGVIVVTASIAATEGQVGQAAYAASKGGVAGMVLPLARELGDYGIRIAGISPGVFRTPMTEGLPEKARETVFAAVPPWPRRPGTPAEFADMVLGIVANPMLNGEVIRLDGGLRMPARV